MDFNIKNTDYYISKNVFLHQRTPERIVENFEIEFYTTDGNISVINDINYPQKYGNVLVACPGDKRYSIDSFECHCIHFLCNEPQITEILRSLPKIIEPHNSDAIITRFHNFQNASDFSEAARSMYIRGNLLELISLLLVESESSKHYKYDRYLKQILYTCEYMEKNYEENLSLSDLAELINLSPGFFHKVFKSIKKITPNEYLSRVRIKNAKSLLRTSNMPLAEIAIACGFGSQGYFNYVFKKITGITPKAYRDKKQIII